MYTQINKHSERVIYLSDTLYFIRIAEKLYVH